MSGHAHARRLTGVSMLIAGAAHALAAVRPIDNPDTFGHLAQGRVIDANGGPPALDPFSFWQAAPQPWPNYEWLSDWIGFRVHALAGVAGLHGLTLLAVVSAALLAVSLAARRGGSRSALACALLSIAALPAVRFRMLARPDLVAIPLALVFLHLVPDTLERRSAWRAVLVIALQIVWTNLHGSHLLGPAIVGACALASWPDRRRVAIGSMLLVASIAACCVTPFGMRLTIDAARHVVDPELRGAVSEWRAWGPELPIVWLLEPVLLGLALAAGARRFVRSDPAVRALAIVAAVLLLGGLRSLRFVPLAMVVGAAALATLPLSERLAGIRAAFTAAAAAIAIAGVGLATTGDRLGGFGVDTRLVPSEACDAIERDFHGARVLASMPASWYVLYGAPSARVVIDGRVPFYGARHVARVAAALRDPGALDAMLHDYPIELVLVQHTSPDDAAAVASLSRDPRFALVHLDATWALFARRGGRFDDAIAARELHALTPGYDAYAILGADDARVRVIRREVARLAEGEDSRALKSWARAMLRLRSLARAGGHGGLRPPSDRADRSRVALALRELDAVRDRVRGVQAVSAMAALVAIDACELDRAGALLEETREAGGDVRESLFAQAELDVRAGRLDAVRAFVASARSMPEAAGDPWLAALDDELAGPPSCSR